MHAGGSTMLSLTDVPSSSVSVLKPARGEA
jgi:hypothetical protein